MLQASTLEPNKKGEGFSACVLQGSGSLGLLSATLRAPAALSKWDHEPRRESIACNDNNPEKQPPGWETARGLWTRWDSSADQSHQLSQGCNHFPGDGMVYAEVIMGWKKTPSVNASTAAPLPAPCQPGAALVSVASGCISRDEAGRCFSKLCG